MRKGKALLDLGEYERAVTTFRDVAKRAVNRENRGEAMLMLGKALAESGDRDRAMAVFQEILTTYERQSVAADAQLEIARAYDEAGDLDEALAQYELVKEQGTGYEAWQIASTRRAEIQRMLDLRDAIADEDDPERPHNRFLLAEQLLERIGDVDAALAEYASLAEDSPDTEWGARALFAEAWILGNRLDRPDAADSVLFRLANYYTGTEVGTYARKRFGYPVWPVEILDPPPVKFVRPEGSDEPPDVVVSRVPPENVPLPPGVSQVKVWVRVRVADDGTAADVKVVKSDGGPEFGEAALTAARESRYLAPDAGGPAFNVMEYTFPPEAPAGGGQPPLDDEPSAAERDAMLDARDAAAADSAAASPLPGAATADSAAAPDSAAADTTTAPERTPQPGARGFRDRIVPGGDPED
jgi:TonB family protein